jgi:hypothetical protein
MPKSFDNLQFRVGCTPEGSAVTVVTVFCELATEFRECFGNYPNRNGGFRRMCLLELVGRAGFEPATNGLKARRRH